MAKVTREGDYKSWTEKFLGMPLTRDWSGCTGRMTILSGKARLAGITGWPVSHSRSPRLHGFWLERYGIDGAYVPLPIEPAQFSAAIHGLMRAGFAGVNVHHPAQGRRVRRLRHGRRARRVAPAP